MPSPTHRRPLLPRHYAPARPLFVAATEALKTLGPTATEDKTADAITDKVDCHPIEALVA